MDPETEQLRKTVQDMERRERVRELASELGLGDMQQGQLVYEVLNGNPKLTPAEALAIAVQRKRAARIHRSRN